MLSHQFYADICFAGSVLLCISCGLGLKYFGNKPVKWKIRDEYFNGAGPYKITWVNGKIEVHADENGIFELPGPATTQALGILARPFVK